uniref:Uncharacterized protein n=1 Tax=Megaselia scalaris TaxID=36166 RepID=T1GT32_MEGSC
MFEGGILKVSQESKSRHESAAESISFIHHHGAPGMAFMMKKKKYKFNVEIQLEELIEVAY